MCFHVFFHLVLTLPPPPHYIIMSIARPLVSPSVSQCRQGGLVWVAPPPPPLHHNVYCQTSGVSICISMQTGWSGLGSRPSKDRFISLITCLSSGMDRLNYVCMYVCAFVCMFVCVRECDCVYVCMYACVCGVCVNV